MSRYPYFTDCAYKNNYFAQFTEGGAQGCYQTTIINNGGSYGYGGYGGGSCDTKTVTETQYQTVTKVSFTVTSNLERPDTVRYSDNDRGYNGHNEGDPDPSQDRHTVCYPN